MRSRRSGCDMVRARKAALVAAVCWGIVALWAPPASAATASHRHTELRPRRRERRCAGIGVRSRTRASGLLPGDPGHDSGQRRTAGALCGLTTTDAAGTFADPAYPVRRFILVPSLGRTVDCAFEACTIGAAEESDIAGTAAYASISFDPALPDARIKNRADGSILGDDVYNTDRDRSSRATRPVPPGSDLDVRGAGARTTGRRWTASSILVRSTRPRRPSPSATSPATSTSRPR